MKERPFLAPALAKAVIRLRANFSDLAFALKSAADQMSEVAERLREQQADETAADWWKNPVEVDEPDTELECLADDDTILEDESSDALKG